MSSYLSQNKSSNITNKFKAHTTRANRLNSNQQISNITNCLFNYSSNNNDSVGKTAEAFENEVKRWNAKVGEDFKRKKMNQKKR